MNDLYDSAADLVSKAIRGLGVSLAEVTEQTGMTERDLLHLIRTGTPAESFRPVASRLGLDETALARFDHPRESIPLPGDLKQLVLPFEDETVNVWLLEHPDGSLAIDAGFVPSDLEESIEQLSGFDLLITHPHRDHIGGLAVMTARANQAFAPLELDGCQAIDEGERWSSGPWQIEAFNLAGHHPQTLGYRIQGAGLDLAAVGDAVFARSAGGCPGPAAYAEARRTILDFWRTLDSRTLLLPGHGPLTRVDREAVENPFIAGWLSEAAR